MSKQIEDLKVIRRKLISPDYFLIELQSPRKLQTILPGQFAELLIDRSPATFLRRPFSVHDVNYVRKSMTFLIRIAGTGTRTLSGIREGEYVNTLYPLGKPFSFRSLDNVLLIAGGCGAAPLFFLARHLSENGVATSVLLGGKTKKDIIIVDEFEKYSTVYITTEDGTLGEKGFVTEHSLLRKKRGAIRFIYSCGPRAMLEAVADYARLNRIECEVSLENMMACGIGACLCCVTGTIKGNQCVCTEGPVFNSSLLKW